MIRHAEGAGAAAGAASSFFSAMLLIWPATMPAGPRSPPAIFAAGESASISTRPIASRRVGILSAMSNAGQSLPSLPEIGL